ncbi:hypothetical protein [Streptomyces bobili]|uniref:hypothetical protein n=1 Tax=Streptomyces bobili TaxID=67280 RepID=UPI003720A4F3
MRERVLRRQRQGVQPVGAVGEFPFSEIPAGVHRVEHHVSGQRRVVGRGERGCLGQQSGGGAERAVMEGRGGAHPDGADGHRRAVAVLLAEAREFHHAVDVALLGGRFGGQHEPAGVFRTGGGELRGPFVGRHGCGVAAARRGPPGAPLQFRGNLLVGAGRHDGVVPGPPVGVLRLVEGVGERRVHHQAEADRGRLVDGRPHEGMPEAYGVVVHPDQPRGLRRHQIGEPAAEGGGRAQDDVTVTGVLGGRDEQQVAARLRQPEHLVEEGRLDRLRHGQGLPADGRPVRAEGGRKFQEGERVALRFGEHPVPVGR